MLAIRWRVAARDDLDQIVTHIAEDSPWAALDMFELIESSVIPAALNPYLFRIGREPGTREIVAHPNYIVVYRLIDGCVEVVNVVHARQQYPKPSQ